LLHSPLSGLLFDLLGPALLLLVDLLFYLDDLLFDALEALGTLGTFWLSPVLWALADTSWTD